MTEEINGLLVLPGENPVAVRFENSVKGIQSLIGGYFKAIPYRLGEDIWLLCDEDGKLKRLDPNFMFQGNIFVGPVLFVGANELGDDFGDISYADMNLISGFMPMLRARMRDALEIASI